MIGASAQVVINSTAAQSHNIDFQSGILAVGIAIGMVLIAVLLINLSDQ